MANTEFAATACTVVAIQVAAPLWVLIRRCRMWPVLLVNLLFVAAVLFVVLPYLPGEVAYIREGEASELFDYKNVILTAFESVTLLASVLAFCGVLLGKIVAWIGFGGNFALSILAIQFSLTFEFKCCGYL
jgi:hypothetical protein